ncbi:DUF4389 domain-containing protein [Nitrosomonas sp. sh817]|uniref:DUF4389 domain-containing protein n=1 Tax=Nitrosomonas sp. sh817 TaxID=3070658 RepID=UPI0027DCD092|nr:DUF4389 domain-containing protein [Nitrosomonas sp. sh817]WMJ07757.1 DUF4389 domain-containing protein [Nitrosomonas sp. sh817]
MDEEIKQRLQNRKIWQRGFFMLLYMGIYGFCNFLIIAIFFFQFVTLIVTGQPNALLQSFSQSLGTYLRQIIAYMSLNTDHLPFPFSTWPNDDNAEQLTKNSNASD